TRSSELNVPLNMESSICSLICRKMGLSSSNLFFIIISALLVHWFVTYVINHITIKLICQYIPLIFILRHIKRVWDKSVYNYKSDRGSGNIRRFNFITAQGRHLFKEHTHGVFLAAGGWRTSSVLTHSGVSPRSSSRRSLRIFPTLDYLVVRL